MNEIGLRPRWFLAVLLVVFGVACVPGTAVAAKRCGRAQATNSHESTVTIRVTARHMRCRKAKSVLRRFWRRDPDGPGDVRRIRGFSYVYVNFWEPGRIAFRCRSGGRVARGYWTRDRP